MKINQLVLAIRPSTTAVVAKLPAVGQGEEGSIFAVHAALTCASIEAKGPFGDALNHAWKLGFSDQAEACQPLTAVYQQAGGTIMCTVAVTDSCGI